MSSSSICAWYVDLTSDPASTVPVQISFPSLPMGTLLIEVFDLPKGVTIQNVAPIQYQITESNYKSFEDMSIPNTNYIVFIYYTGNSQASYSGLTIDWGNKSSGSSSSLSQILTITALCLVSIFCLGCCGVLCRRLYKSARSTSRVYDQVVANYQRRARAYEALPENSILSEDDIQRFFPRQPYKENLLEVGEKVCCICFEE